MILPKESKFDYLKKKLSRNRIPKNVQKMDLMLSEVPP